MVDNVGVSTNRVSKLKVILFSLMVMESDSLISSFLGLDAVLSSWFYASIMILFACIALFKLVKVKDFKEIRTFYYPFIAFFIFSFVSLISANFIFVKPVNDWLPSLYMYAPIFIFYFLYCFDYKFKEIIYSFIVVSILTSILLIADRFLHFNFLDTFQRRSAFFSLDIRRVVLLKNEVIFGFIAVVSLIIIDKKSFNNNIILIVLALFLFLVQAFIMESRMGFLAMGVAMFTLMYIKGLTKKIFSMYVLGVLTVVFVFPIVFSEHIEELSKMSLYDSESNISIRFETVTHFYDAYIKSCGWGIGSMSSNGLINNILHSEEHNNIVDAGAISSLLQFGPAGMFIWILFTYNCLKTFRIYFIIKGKADPYSAACFAFLLSFTVSLWPLSFFTASWCIAIGGTLLYLMWNFQTELSNMLKINFVSKN